MKTIIKPILILTWVTAASLALSLWWLHNPDYYPKLPESAWSLIDKLYQAPCCEAQADIEFIVRFILALITTSIITASCLTLLRKKRLKAKDLDSNDN